MTRKVCLGLFLLIAAWGCSSSSGQNSDQGVSISFLGWFTDSTGTQGSSGASIALSSAAGGDVSEAQIGTLRFMGVSNNLVGQGFRINGILHSYRVPGSNLTIPDDTFLTSSLLGPSPDANSGLNPGSTLPGGISNRPNTNFVQVPVLTASVAEYLNLNRARLPEPPFSLIVTSEVYGVTTAGRALETNPVDFEIVVLPDIAINPDTGTNGDSAGTIGGGLGGGETTGASSESLTETNLEGDPNSSASNDTDTSASSTGIDEFGNAIENAISN